MARTQFLMDNSDEANFAGYVTGIADTVNTTEYIGAAVQYTKSILSRAFEVAADVEAHQNKDKWQHVYEWGDSYGDRSQVGNPHMRLWALVPRGRGRVSAVGFTFLPSVKEVPLHPKEEAAGVEARHTFTWKAQVFEYGMTVRIAPVEAARGKLVFFDERVNKIIMRTKTVVTVPGKDSGAAGTFTTFFVGWWRTQAPVIYMNEIRPELEKNIVPRDAGGRFAKGGGRGGRKMGARESVTISNVEFDRGMQQAKADMRKIAAGYNRGAGGWENYRGD